MTSKVTSHLAIIENPIQISQTHNCTFLIVAERLSSAPINFLKFTTILPLHLPNRFMTNFVLLDDRLSTFQLTYRSTVSSARMLLVEEDTSGMPIPVDHHQVCSRGDFTASAPCCTRQIALARWMLTIFAQPAPRPSTPTHP